MNDKSSQRKGTMSMVGRIAKVSCFVMLASGLGGCVTGNSEDPVKPAEESIETYELDKATQGDLLDAEIQGDKATAPIQEDKSDQTNAPSDVDASTLTADPLEEPAAVDQAPATSGDEAAPKAVDKHSKKKHKKK